MSTAGRPFARGAVAVPTGREAAAFDLHAIESGVPQAALMESAGRAAADLAGFLAPEGRIVVLAGSGNNGGDALVLARTLRARGRDITVFLAGERLRPDPVLHGWHFDLQVAADQSDATLAAGFDSAALVVDGLLGTGLKAAPREPAARLIRLLQDPERRVLALDVPSGVDADTGGVSGVAVRACCTIAFGWPKLGVLLEPGRSRAGRVVVAEIGFPPVAEDRFGARLLTPGWLARVRPRRATVTHKYRVGAALVLGGGVGMAGALLLAGRAALRSGAGYLRLASVAGHRDALQAALPDAPFVAFDDLPALAAALDGSSAAAVGPGMGVDADAETALGCVLDAGLPTILDADALNLLAMGRPRAPAALTRGGPFVLTPHPGEMARLLACSVEAVEGDRPAAARRLAQLTGSVVVLKGTPSLVAQPDGHLDVSGIASSDLAVAGMGDVLSGAVVALLAQGLEPRDAAGAALLVTALAALGTGLGAGLAASDVPDGVPGALSAVGSGTTDLPFGWVDLDLDAPR